MSGTPAKAIRERPCYAQLMGTWAIQPSYLDSAMVTVRAMGVDAIIAKADTTGRPKHNPYTKVLGKTLGCEDCDLEAEGPSEVDALGYATTPDGTAVIAIHGPISKQETSTMAMFGGTATASVREALASALQDGSVKRILFHVYSPGGTVNGVGDLADDMRAARSKKPTMAYIEDLGASAAYWLAAQAGSIYASPHAEIGSIGVYSAVYDESEAYEKAGIKPIVFRSTKLKGGMVAGEKPSKEFIESYQKSIDNTNAAFVAAIAAGRGVPEKKALSWATAELWFGSEAQKLGLIDGVGSLQEAVARFADAKADTSPKRYQAVRDSIQSGAPKMADPPKHDDPVVAELQSTVASLTDSLEQEKSARVVAENANNSQKQRLEQAITEVNDLKSKALHKEATEAATAAIDAGKFANDQKDYLTGLYKDLGKEAFAKLVQAVPAKLLGVGGGNGLEAQALSKSDKTTLLASIDPKRFGAKPKGA